MTNSLTLGSRSRQGDPMRFARIAALATLSLALLGAPLAVKAQQPGTTTARIGYLSSQSEAGARANSEAFRRGLRDLGYVEGRNLAIAYRWADGNNDRLPALAKELAGLNLDLIVSVGGPSAARAAKAATTSIPVVFVSGKAVEAGLVASLARPGGNLTGLDILAEELDVKRLELLRETLPKATHVAVLWNPGTPEGEVQRRSLETAALTMGLKLRFWGARRPSDLGAVIASMGREHVDALLVSTDPMFSSEVGRIIDGTMEARLPAIHFSPIFPQRGGLMSYGADIAAIYRQAATYVDRILKGAKPADLPVEQPTKFQFVINLKTAKALGLTIPPAVLARVNE